MLFTMLSGEVPPGTLHVTPAVERLVQRALDTDVDAPLQERGRPAREPARGVRGRSLGDRRSRRGDQGRRACRAPTPTSTTRPRICSPRSGSLPGAVQVTPIRPSVDIRAEAIGGAPCTHADRPARAGSMRCSPISTTRAELHRGRRRRPVQARSDQRADPDGSAQAGGDRPGPLAARAVARRSGRRRRRRCRRRSPSSELDAPAPRGPNTRDEAAAMGALAGPRRAGPPGVDRRRAGRRPRPTKLEHAAQRAERRGARRDQQRGLAQRHAPAPIAARPIVDRAADFDDVPTPRLKSRALGIIVAARRDRRRRRLLRGLHRASRTRTRDAARRDRREAEQGAPRSRPRARRAGAGRSRRDRASRRRRRTPASGSSSAARRSTSMPLSSTADARIRIELDGYQAVDTEVLAANWTGEGKDAQGEASTSTLKPVARTEDRQEPRRAAAGRRRRTSPSSRRASRRARARSTIETVAAGRRGLAAHRLPNTGVRSTSRGRAATTSCASLRTASSRGYVAITADEWRDGGDPNDPDRRREEEAGDREDGRARARSRREPPKPKKGK